VRFIADEEVAYAAQRSREVHDLWHVLFGCHTNVFGELALKAVEYVQVCETEPGFTEFTSKWAPKCAFL
jgi:ubiquinone biosynthesis protein Coq4